MEKEVFSDFDIGELSQLLPIQNGGRSAYNIAMVGIKILNGNKKDWQDVYAKMESVV